MSIVKGRPHLRRRPVLYVLLALAVLVAGFLIEMSLLLKDVRAFGDRALAVQLQQGSLATLDDGQGLDQVRASLQDARPALARLKRHEVLLKVGAASIGWLPGVGPSLQAAPHMIGLAEHLLSSAELAVDEAGRLAPRFDALLKGEPATDGVSAGGGLAAAASELELARQHRSRIDAGRVLSQFRDALDTTDQAMAWLGAVIAVEGLAEAADSVAWLSHEAAAQPPGGGSVAFEELEVRLRLVEQELGRARAAMMGVKEPAPGLSDFLILSEVATANVLSALEPLKPAMALLEEEREFFGRQGVLVRAMDSLRPKAPELLRTADALKQDAQRFQEMGLDSDVTAIVRDGARLAATWLDRLGGMLELAAIAGEVGPEALGMDAPRHYLVLGHNADELRPTGGYVAGVWLVTVSGGAIDDVRYYDTVDVDDLSKLSLYPLPPEGLVWYMNARVWLMRDVSWDPDFPTTAGMAQDMFWLGQARQVDGVIGINQWALAPVVKALDMVRLPDGGSLRGDNFIASLEKGTDAEGRAFMDTAVTGILASVRQGLPPAKALALGQSILDGLESRNILVYLNDGEAQQAIEDRGWDGALAEYDGDYLAVFDSNVGWTKVNRNIEREVEYEVFLPDAGPPSAKVSVTYRNDGNSQAGEGCQQWGLSGSYEELKNACYWDYFRIYVPGGSLPVALPVLPLPQGSVRGSALAGQNTVSTRPEHGKQVFDGLLLVPTGQERTVTFSYRLPQAAVSRTADGVAYSLLIQKQPGTPEFPVRVRISYPSALRIASASSAYTTLSPTQAEFSLRLDSDQELVLRLASSK